jgi:hypothetical protein
MADAATILNPAEAAVAADLAGTRYRVGEKRGLWRVITFGFPMLTVAVASMDSGGVTTEYAFRMEVDGFPGTAPAVRIWDLEEDKLLGQNKRPTGNRRVAEAFKVWGSETVYRPWDRIAGPHFGGSPQPQGLANLAWHPARDLTFILEDLHELLNLDARASGAGQTA